MNVTRVEVADSLEDAFASKDDLITAVLAHYAHPGVLAALASLPNQKYRSLLDLWPRLAEVPIDH
ncbi:MAG: hypothetical protein ACRDQA_14780 [Nocardioidaceae bacterium]